MKQSEKDLVLDYLDGKMGEDRVNELNDLLRKHQEARSFLRMHSGIEVQLREIALNSNECKRRKVSTPHSRLASIFSMAAALAIGLLLWWSQKSKQPSPEEMIASYDGPVSTLKATERPVAYLKHTALIQWQEGSHAPPTGSALMPGWLRLSEGTIQIEFVSGARLLVTGPASIRLDSELSAYLESGKLSAQVPEPAHGFIVHTPRVQVKDLGTSFGLEVSDDRDPEIHCFEGSVELFDSSKNDEVKLLDADLAVQLRNDQWHKIPVRREDFPNEKALAQQAVINSTLRLKEWSKLNEVWAQDPCTLALYTFEEESELSPSVRNRSTLSSMPTSATIVGAGWTEGRWRGKRALEFRSLGDRLRFSIPGSYEKISLSAWVRVDSLPNDYHSLLLPSRYYHGNFHWNIERGGEMRLTQVITDKHEAAIKDAYWWNGPVSGKGMNALDFGRWMHLITTYDSITGLVSHFRDGQMVGQGSFVKPGSVVFGEMEFGNWGADATSAGNIWPKEQNASHRIRNFVGRLDHLWLSSRILGSEEIKQLYQVGRP